MMATMNYIYIDILVTRPNICQDTETKVIWNMKKRGEALFLVESWISILQPTCSLTFIRHNLKHQQPFGFTTSPFLGNWQYVLHLPIYEIQNPIQKYKSYKKCRNNGGSLLKTVWRNLVLWFATHLYINSTQLKQSTMTTGRNWQG
jgi:hypothetical protein